MRFVMSCLTILTCVVALGCGGGSTRPKVYPVSGKIMYKGAPVKDALVNFRAKGAPRISSGTTNANGEFKLTTFDTNDGALAGEQVVTITKMSQAAVASGAAPMQMTKPEDYLKAVESSGSTQPPGADLNKNELPGKYSDPATSGLTRTVVAGEKNEFNIDLTE